MVFTRRQNKIIAATLVVGAVTLVSQLGGSSFSASPADQSGLQSAGGSAPDTKAILAYRSEGGMFEFGQEQKASLVPGKAESITVAQNALDF